MTSEKRQDGVDDLDATINYMKYAHERIDTNKDSIYLRASVVMAAIAFLMPQGSAIMIEAISALSENVFLRALALILGLAFVFASGASLWYAMACVCPLKSAQSIYGILKKSKTEANKDEIALRKEVPVFTAFPHITAMKRDDFEAAVLRLEKVGILGQLVSATYTLSHLTEHRYVTLRKAFICLSASLVSFGLLIGFRILCLW